MEFGLKGCPSDVVVRAVQQDVGDRLVGEGETEGAEWVGVIEDCCFSKAALYSDCARAAEE